MKRLERTSISMCDPPTVHNSEYIHNASPSFNQRRRERRARGSEDCPETHAKQADESWRTRSVMSWHHGGQREVGVHAADLISLETCSNTSFIYQIGKEFTTRLHFKTMACF